MNRRIARGGKLTVALAVSAAALVAILRRPAKPTTPRPEPPAAAPSVSDDPSANDPSASSTLFGPEHLGTEPAGQAPSVDPMSLAEVPPPPPVTSCPEDQELAKALKLREKGLGQGCGTKVGLEKDGLWVIHYPDGRVKAGNFERNEENGIWTTWYANGRRAALVTMVHGAPDGVQLEWHQSGQRYIERTYKMGVLDGPTIMTFADGTIRREMWSNGRRISPP